MRNRLWVTLGAALALGACAGRFAPAPVDPASAAADRVRGVQSGRQAYPDLRRLPPKPQDLPTPATFAGRAAALRGDRGALLAWAEAHPAENTDAEPFARSARERVPTAVREAVPPADQAQRSSAWAERQRRLGQAPPPPG